MLSIKEKIKEHLSFSADIKAVRIIDKLLNYAIRAEAAEIIFEPEEEKLLVVFRLNSGAEKIFSVPKRIEKELLGGLKEMAGVSGKDNSFSGNGTFKKDYPGFKIIFSLTVHPTSNGEKITIDLHKEKFEMLKISRLGFNAPALAAIEKNFREKHGLVLVIGGYDSGRTTTLYSFLDYINKPELNVTTIERSIAFDIPQINQSQLDPISGYSSSVAINLLRRQNIDAAMIGEISDRETAEAATHLALGGRFVLSGLYSKNIGTALEFFRDLPVNLAMLTSAVKIVITQRLLRKNCPHCLVEEKISVNTRQKLKEKFLLDDLLPRLRASKIISEKIVDSKDLVFYKSRGCAACGNTGFMGRIGNFEVLEMTPEVKKIIKEGHFSAVRGEVKKQGRYLLEEDALIKALNGLVEIEEVFKGVE